MLKNRPLRSSSAHPKPVAHRGWRASRWLAALLAVALTASHATAGPRIMELQIKSSKLFTLVEQRLAEETPCYLDEFELPTQSGMFVLDHVAFPGGIDLRRGGGGIQLDVPVQVFTKTSECIRNPNCGLTDFQPNSPLHIDLVFDVTAEAVEDGDGDVQPYMCIRFNSVELNGLLIPAAAAPGVYEALQSVALDKCNRINVDAIKKLLAGEPTIKMVGASADSSLNRIALRIEFDDPFNANAGPDPSWNGFFNGNIQPGGTGLDWSLFIDSTMFTQATVDRFTSELAGEERVHLTSGTEAIWRPMSELGGRVDVSFGANIDVDICAIGTDADIKVAFSASADDPNNIRTDGSLEIDLDGDDIFYCSVLGGPASLALFTSASTLVSVISIESLLLGADGTLPGECTQQGDESFSCNFPVHLPRISLSKWNLPLSPSGSMTLTTFFGDTAGPILSGPMTTSPIPPHFPLDVASSGFHYGVQGGCSTLHLGWGCGVHIEGTGKLCRPIEVLDDPLNVFEVNWQGSHPLGTYYIGYPGQNFDVIFPRVGSDIAAYNANPYPCKLLFRTSIGSKTLAISGPDASTINPGESAALLGEAQANCLFELNFIPHRMNPLWLVDPPPFDVQSQLVFEDLSSVSERTTTELLNVSVIGLESIGGSPDENGQTTVAGVPMQMEFNFRSRSNSVGGAPRVKRTDAAAQSMLPDEMDFTLTAPVSVDLVAKMKNGELEGEALLSEAFSRILEADPDQLPPGVQSASFFVEIDPARLTFNGPLEIVSPPAAQSGLDVCGDGACGAGSAVGMPLLMLGTWFSRRRPRRRRNEQAA